jgi:predicted HTH domain antitoxin
VGKTINERVTLARAAELVDKSIREFIEILTSNNIPWTEYTIEHKDEDDETMKVYTRRT